jgi:glycine cleavage system transcriptional repressor
VVIAALPDGTDPAVLRDALRDAEQRLDLTVSVGPMRETAPEHTQGEPWVISVYGADHPGIVARVSRLLADNDVNIADLATHVVAGPTPVYVMVLEVTIPGDAPPIEQALRTLAAELGVDVSMHPMEPETL